LATQASAPERYFPRHFSLAASQRLRATDPTDARGRRRGPKGALERRSVVQREAGALGLELLEGAFAGFERR
jgi:hypothetical protein